MRCLVSSPDVGCVRLWESSGNHFRGSAFKKEGISQLNESLIRSIWQPVYYCIYFFILNCLFFPSCALFFSSSSLRFFSLSELLSDGQRSQLLAVREGRAFRVQVKNGWWCIDVILLSPRGRFYWYWKRHAESLHCWVLPVFFSSLHCSTFTDFMTAMWCENALKKARTLQNSLVFPLGGKKRRRKNTDTKFTVTFHSEIWHCVSITLCYSGIYIKLWLAAELISELIGKYINTFWPIRMQNLTWILRFLILAPPTSKKPTEISHIMLHICS